MTNQIKHIDDVKEKIDFDKVFNALTISRPILFSTPMVQAIDAKRKTQTRRTRGLEEINKNPDDWQFEWADYALKHPFRFTQKSSVTSKSLEENNFHQEAIKCPFGKPGDLLWVRETFGKFNDEKGDYIAYKALFDKSDSFYLDAHKLWKPSIHMPKEAARLWLQIKSICLERLQTISQSDAGKEGVECVEHFQNKELFYKDYTYYTKQAMSKHGGFLNPIKSFKSLWISINGEQSWKLNPWVWVIEFELLTKKPQ